MNIKESSKMHYFRYHSTNCFLFENNCGDLLAVDAGWPCSFFEYARLVKSIGFRMKQIRWALVTHFHLDHAGLVSDFMEQGIQCIVFQNQETAIDPMERTIRKNYRDYKPIHQESLIRWNTVDSIKSFAKIGIVGSTLVTRGHSDDGKALLRRVEERALELCIAEVATYTLGDGIDYPPYEQTRMFYFQNGFEVYQRNQTDNPGCPEEIRIRKQVVQPSGPADEDATYRTPCCEQSGRTIGSTPAEPRTDRQ